MLNRDRQRIIRIKRYCESVAETLALFGGYENYKADSIFRHAACMCLLQIGELTKGLTQEFRTASESKIQWRLWRETRNWAAHHYDSAMLETEWITLTQSIPDIYQFCVDILVQNTTD